MWIYFDWIEWNNFSKSGFTSDLHKLVFHEWSPVNGHLELMHVYKFCLLEKQAQASDTNLVVQGVLGFLTNEISLWAGIVRATK